MTPLDRFGTCPSELGTQHDPHHHDNHLAMHAKLLLAPQFLKILINAKPNHGAYESKRLTLRPHNLADYDAKQAPFLTCLERFETPYLETDPCD